MTKSVLNIAILLTGVLLTGLHYELKPAPTEKEIHDQSSSMSGGVDWRNHTAPDFELTTTRGEHFRLSENVGKKIVVLNFFATWCGPCRAEMPELNRYFNEHKLQPFILLGIDAEEKGDRVDAFLNELKVDFPAGVDDGPIRQKYGVESFPTTVVIGVDGKVQLYETGALANADVAFDGPIGNTVGILQRQNWRRSSSSSFCACAGHSAATLLSYAMSARSKGEQKDWVATVAATMNERSISRKRVHGEVEHNDGESAEIQTMGIEGIEKDLLLETIQVHRCDTDYSREQFRDRYPVGSWLGICTTIEVRRLESDTDALEEGTATGERQLLQ